MSQIDRKADRHTRGRIMFMMAVFCVLLTSAVIIRLAFLQIINQDFYQQKALSNQTRDITLYPTRGTIYDTNGKPLAISASTELHLMIVHIHLVQVLHQMIRLLQMIFIIVL